MIWQDIVITVAGLVFTISLIPQVISGFKKKKGLITKMTSGPTFVVLYAMAFTYVTLSLYFSAAVTIITASLWLLMFIQKIMYKSA